MVGGIEKELYDAVLKGDAITFIQLVDGDPHLLDRVSLLCPNITPLLHTAILQGNEEIIGVLARNPQLVRQLDYQKSSPLHIAAAKGNATITDKLISEAPEMCWGRDYHGMNPFHVAAMYGNVSILKSLINHDLSPAREKMDRGQTVLHLCVKHGRVEALKVLVECLGELVCVNDDDGDTILHLAARCKQYEIIQYLVENNIIEKNKRNSKGETTLSILEEFPPDETTTKIKDILQTWWWKGSPQSLHRFREIGMVIPILIANMAFQALVSPPGGLWQDDSSAHRAGKAIMAYTHPKIYKQFIRSNNVAFASSMIIIFLLTTGLSSTHILVTMAIIHAMWVSMAAIAVSYGISQMVITPNMETNICVIYTCWIVLLILIYSTYAVSWARSFRRARNRAKKELFCTQVVVDAITIVVECSQVGYFVHSAAATLLSVFIS